MGRVDKENRCPSRSSAPRQKRHAFLEASLISAWRTAAGTCLAAAKLARQGFTDNADKVVVDDWEQSNREKKIINDTKLRAR